MPSKGAGPRQAHGGVGGEETGEYPWTRVDIAIAAERAGVKGWIAFASEVRATAQGSTEEEAKANLSALLKRYPDLLKFYGASGGEREVTNRHC